MTSSSTGPSLFSTIASLFGGVSASSSGTRSASKSKQLPRRTAFGSAFGSGSGGGIGEDWSLPYTHYGGGPSSSMFMNGGSGAAAAYPPSLPGHTAGGPYMPAIAGTANASLAEFTNVHNPNASSSNLVQHGPYSASVAVTSSSSFARLRSSFGVALPGAGFSIAAAGAGGAAGLGAGSAVSSNMPSSAYPPLRHTWRRIRSWCRKQYPELWDTVNYPALEAEIDEFEEQIGFALPPSVRESFLLHNGQELESYANSSGGGSCTEGLFFGMTMLSLEQSLQEWGFWRSVDDDPETGASVDVRGNMTSCPDGWVRNEYSDRGWIPLISDRVGNYIGVDLNPPNPYEIGDENVGGIDRTAVDGLATRIANGCLDANVNGDRDTTATATATPTPKQQQQSPRSGGLPGQVIVFGRDFDTKVVLWRGEGEGGWGRFLQHFAEELEAGELWTLDDTSTGSEDDEDAIGYENYFGGGGGGGKGGGDRGGDGHAGFKLHGDYKGWPVLEAWADRSIRAWEDAGFQVGLPANQDPGFYAQYAVGGGGGAAGAEEAGPSAVGVGMGVELGSDLDQNPCFAGAPATTPLPALQVHLSEDEAHQTASDQQQEPVLLDPLTEAASSNAEEGSSAAGAAASSAPSAAAVTPSHHPLQQETIRTGLLVSDSVPSTPTLGIAPRSTDTLSPPPASFKSTGKRRQEFGAPSRDKDWERNAGILGPGAGAVRRRAPPPATAASLDLPTLADVHAAHAAALAEAGRGASHQFEFHLKSADQSIDLEDRHSADGRYSTGSASASGSSFFGKTRREGTSGLASSGSVSALRDVVVDPASISPRPSASAEGPRFPGSTFMCGGSSGTGPGRDGLGSLPGTPRLMSNGSESFAALIDAGSQPSSPAPVGQARSLKLSYVPSTSQVSDLPQTSPSLIQSLPGGGAQGGAGASVGSNGFGSEHDTARGSPKPLLRALHGSHSRTNLIKGAMPSVA
ncbi:hypothetical protein K437DRAFT_256811 [Tilletiaria anomala UBC 951]|uniref:Knr4/Smi1-like domain-containing protein n=1 Tax=Tilletiaria anomala (strain ATCC 24038 / CBS 436.72 / UBC 951) TaxID=1037660 RepID=A0A066VU06_TILAU|nr:uncharacterized protein K437DRAFT_256811 [Tilletiaria anomala UBC 951]KDN44946.1 hypothetical protein K437DRAFT_256811 [Tilletiaria anomala UBC 951]